MAGIMLCGFILYLRVKNFGGLAHLARALAWQARGDRFESGILHNHKLLLSKNPYKLACMDFLLSQCLELLRGLIDKLNLVQRIRCYQTQHSICYERHHLTETLVPVLLLYHLVHTNHSL